MAKPIVVVGSINLDLVASCERFPALGETISGTNFSKYYGGKGANQAVAAAKLGHPVIMIGKVGNDGFGAELAVALKSSGVDTLGVQEIRGSSGIALIITDRKGENGIVVVPGANHDLSPDDLHRYKDTLLNADMILTQLEIPLDTVEYLAKFALKNNIPLMLDPAPAHALPEIVFRGATWITPNEVEASLLLEQSDANLDERDIAEQLAARGVRNLAFKLGSRGVLLRQEDNSSLLIPGFPVKAVDTTAAGDAFNGAFAVALVSGKPPVESAQFANAVAAISVTRPGAQPSMPSRIETELFLNEHGNKLESQTEGYGLSST